MPVEVTANLVYLRQLSDVWAMQNSERQAHHLQIFGSSSRAYVARLGAHIVHDGALQPGNEKVCSLTDYLVADTAQTVEDDRASTALHIVQGGVGEGESDGGRDGVAVDLIESVGGHDWSGFESLAVTAVQVFLADTLFKPMMPSL